MPALAAASPLPLTILVLAWDEAAPAVRTLIKAAPGLAAAASIGPLLVLTPPASEVPPAPAAVPSDSLAPFPLLASPSLAASASTAPPARQPAAVAAPPETPPAASNSEASTAATRPAGWTAVRVVRLAYSEPNRVSQFANLTPAAFPAAPYLGATPPSALATAGLAIAEALPAVANSLVEFGATQFAAPKPQPATSPAPELYTTEEVLAPDPEADLLPGAGTQEIHPLTPAQPVSESAAFSATDEATAIQPTDSVALGLDEDAPVELVPAATPSPGPDDLPAFSPIGTAPATATSEAEFAEAGSQLADESLAGSAPETEPTAVASPPLPVMGHYPAPDLNTQVIRYARFAVPAALAEGPFTAIYAPAWPTWLAALELRQRTGCPLVLHLPALAAGREPADTAAGWPAEIQRQALRQADLVLTETYALARRLRRELGLAGTTVRVVPAADGSAVARALRRARRREVAR